MTNTFFISDMHFGHAKILKYDKRPFNTVGECDKAIINNWNRRVGKNDTVYILGDISWYDAEKTAQILESLKGKKYLITGNHDGLLIHDKGIIKQFSGIQSYKEIALDQGKTRIILCHYPIPCFKNHYYPGWYHLYGHVHSTYEWEMIERIRKEVIQEHNNPCNMYNVGCMMPYMNYTPRTLEEIIEGYNMTVGKGENENNEE